MFNNCEFPLLNNIYWHSRIALTVIEPRCQLCSLRLTLFNVQILTQLINTHISRWASHTLHYCSLTTKSTSTHKCCCFPGYYSVNRCACGSNPQFKELTAAGLFRLLQLKAIKDWCERNELDDGTVIFNCTWKYKNECHVKIITEEGSYRSILLSEGTKIQYYRLTDDDAVHFENIVSYMRNKIGSKTTPWGTPHLILLYLCTSNSCPLFSIDNIQLQKFETTFVNAIIIRVQFTNIDIGTIFCCGT